MRPSRTATACPSSTLPAGSTGTTQRGRIRKRFESIPASLAWARRCPRARLLSWHPLQLDYDAAVGREAFDQRLAVGLAALLVRARFDLVGLAGAEALDPGGVEAPGHEIGLDRFGALLGQLLVVLRGAKVIGVAVDAHGRDRREVLSARDDLLIELGA